MKRLNILCSGLLFVSLLSVSEAFAAASGFAVKSISTEEQVEGGGSGGGTGGGGNTPNPVVEFECTWHAGTSYGPFPLYRCGDRYKINPNCSSDLLPGQIGFHTFSFGLEVQVIPEEGKFKICDLHAIVGNIQTSQSVRSELKSAVCALSVSAGEEIDLNAIHVSGYPNLTSSCKFRFNLE